LKDGIAIRVNMVCFISNYNIMHILMLQCIYYSNVCANWVLLILCNFEAAKKNWCCLQRKCESIVVCSI